MVCTSHIFLLVNTLGFMVYGHRGRGPSPFFLVNASNTRILTARSGTLFPSVFRQYQTHEQSVFPWFVHPRCGLDTCDGAQKMWNNKPRTDCTIELTNSLKQFCCLLAEDWDNLSLSDRMRSSRRPRICSPIVTAFGSRALYRHTPVRQPGAFLRTKGEIW